MTLTEYLKARRSVEQADPKLIKEAERLAKIIKAKGFPTVDLQWQELIKMAETEQPFLFEVL